jgi:O-antigen/teichoic acid export membrane protein
MSRSHRIFSAVVLGYVYQVLVTLVGLWLTPILLDRIGRDEYGLWLIIGQVVAYVGLLDLGIVALLPREVAFSVGRAGGTSDPKLQDLIGRTVWLTLCQLPLVAAASAGVWYFLTSSWENLYGPLAVILGVFVAAFPFRILGAVLRGLQDLAFLGRLQIGAWMVSTTLTVALVFAEAGLLSLVAGWIANQTVMTTLCWYRLRQKFPEVWPDRLPPFRWGELRHLLVPSFWTSLTQVAQVLLTGTDLLILGKLLGPGAVVVYACTGKLVTVFANQPYLLMQSAGPAVSEIKAGLGCVQLFRSCSALNQVVLLASGAIVCLVLGVNEGFVKWWVGPDQYGGLPLTILLLGTMLARHWNFTLSYTVFYLGYERRLAIAAIVDGLATVASSVVLVQTFGLIGAPVGSLIGLLVCNMPVSLLTLSRELGVSPGALLLQSWPWFWRFASLGGLTMLVVRSWYPSDFPLLAVTAAGLIGAYAALMVPLLLRPPLQSYAGALGAWLKRKWDVSLRLTRDRPVERKEHATVADRS